MLSGIHVLFQVICSNVVLLLLPFSTQQKPPSEYTELPYSFWYRIFVLLYLITGKNARLNIARARFLAAAKSYKFFDYA